MPHRPWLRYGDEREAALVEDRLGRAIFVIRGRWGHGTGPCCWLYTRVKWRQFIYEPERVERTREPRGAPRLRKGVKLVQTGRDIGHIGSS